MPLTVKMTPIGDGRSKGTLQLHDHANPALPFASTHGDPIATVNGDALPYLLPVKPDGEHGFFVRIDNDQERFSRLHQPGLDRAAEPRFQMTFGISRPTQQLRRLEPSRLIRRSS